jgi:hypothetical protein
MRDLVGHDRSPSAYLVYLWLLRETQENETGRVGASCRQLPPEQAYQSLRHKALSVT